MASVQFQIHTDKENASSSSTKTGAGGIQGSKAKVFQAHKTPRRALGSVNEANRVGGRMQGSHDLKSGISVQPAALKQKNFVTHNDSKLKGEPDKENVKSRQQEEKGSVRVLKAKQQQTSVSYCLPDIEYMPPPSPPRDEDEDILPMRKRPSTYVHKLLNWRPPCFFGTVVDSEEEEEEVVKDRQQMMDELDKLPLPNDHDIFLPASLHLSYEKLDVDSIQLPSMEDVPLPYIDEDQDCSPEALLPSLDDSLGLVPHLGSLEILGKSLPSVKQ
ncbi:uncharacterized protein LOC143278934 [Babylonia areolata]|uniref:uncharacterized protein LOC143278934 n=1 Tax=Babylonia areolata TaxID=304850 RepID=UPI003FD0C1B4